MFANHQTLLWEDVYNMILGFEEPTKAYLETNKLLQLTQLGHYHKKRVQLTSMIYVVFPAESQFYFLKHRMGAHHQD